jgi:hypothetical protein
LKRGVSIAFGITWEWLSSVKIELFSHTFVRLSGGRR